MGCVAAPHGVRGALKVQRLSDDAQALLDCRQWWLRPRDGDAWRAYEVVSSRMHSGAIVAELRDVMTRDEAGGLRGASVGVPRDDLPALGDGEHYEADLLGLPVVNRAGDVLGSVVGFVASGAHPIVRVKGDDGERLIPWIEQYIDRVDVAARRIDVDWPLDY
ncbi:MAG TPA: ribosome maturation factor RimM [Casimicrobiaceae bacterium]|nr:ribosome maturation factor RimM [Casimicrobiaceae bacterium]